MILRLKSISRDIRDCGFPKWLKHIGLLLTLVGLYFALVASAEAGMNAKEIFSAFDPGKYNQTIEGVIKAASSETGSILVISRYIEPYQQKIVSKTNIPNLGVFVVDEKAEYLLRSNHERLPFRVFSKKIDDLVYEINLSPKAGPMVRYYSQEAGVSNELPDRNEQAPASRVKVGDYSMDARLEVPDSDKSSIVINMGSSSSGESKITKLYEDSPLQLQLVEESFTEGVRTAVGLARDGDGGRISYIWILVVSPDGKAEAGKFEVKSAGSYSVSLVPYQEQPAFIKILHKARQGGVMSLVSGKTETLLVTTQGKLVWREMSKFVEDVDPFQAIQVCGDKVAVVHKINETSKGVLGIRVVDSSREKTSVHKAEVLEAGVMSDFFVHSGARDTILAYINYMKYEDKRRPDGWYGWRGYKLEEIRIDCDE